MAHERAIPFTALMLCMFGLLQVLFVATVYADETPSADSTVQNNLHKPEHGTLSDSVKTEEEKASRDGYSVAERKLMEDSKEKYEFQAEVGRLMDIIIHSLYSKKEIFLRELISNASDACDKIRFIGLTEPEKLGEGEMAELDIRIEADKEAKTLTITDKGIGMSKADLVNNLGTIAKSGTSSFLEAMSKSQDLNLIGQFGVGFYSVYLVADKVTVTSKAADDKQHIWESQAESHFSVVEDPKGDTLGRGTRITLHLKEDAGEFLEEDTLRNLVKRYSEFISFPIRLSTTKEVDVEVPVEEDETTTTKSEDKKEGEEAEGEKKKSDDDDVEVSDAEDDDAASKKKKTKTIKEKKHEWELVNETKAIWLRAPKDVKREEYNNFFKSLTKEFDDPLDFIHFSAEGEIEFKAILFVPKKAPHDMFDKMSAKQTNLKLYVRRVFISDEFDDLVPRYLAFIRGVVDSEDLPLNVSREMLQQSRVLKVIKKKLVSKALDMLKRLSEQEEKAVAALNKGDDADAAKKDDEEKDKKKDDDEEESGDDDEDDEEEDDEDHEKVVKRYKDFHDQFSKSIKLGIIEDSKNRKKLANLVRFPSSATKEGETVSLARYVARMAKEQKHIYYIAGETRKDVENSPYLEKLKKRGFEVLYMLDPIDEYAVQHMDEYEDHRLINVTKEDLKFGDKTERKEKKRLEKSKDELKDLISWYKELLKDKVEKIVVSNRLTTSPCAIVTGTYGYTAHMERLMKAQALNDQSRYNFMAAKKTLELNPYHPIIASLKQKVVDTPEDDATKELASVLYETALISAGFTVDETSTYAQRVHNMLKASLNLDSLEVKEPEEEPETEEEEEKKEDKSSDDDAEEEEEEESASSSGGGKKDDDSSSQSSSDSNNSDRKDEL